ncbi:MAG TPA: hypothetical protein DET40_25260 [Lentisphaeria bacterium]|nr:MAG: hypothetical protein A2X45_18705 [Lentisphaerae bacterium GWF2_50_93]HCE46870.1 hypothetical protein [Lentisphaeria bacterium]
MKIIFTILLVTLSFTAYANPVMPSVFSGQIFVISVLSEVGVLSMILSYSYGFNPFKIFILWLVVNFLTYIVFMLIVTVLEKSMSFWLAIILGEIFIILIEAGFLKLIADLSICMDKGSKKIGFFTPLKVVFIANSVSIIVSLIANNI